MHKVEIYARKLLIWRAQRLSNKQFLYLIALAIGIFSALAVVVLKNGVRLVQNALLNNIESPRDIQYFALPLIGIFLTLIVIKFLIRKPVDHGIPNALHAISKNNGNIERYSIWSSVVAAIITVGFGGSAGLEGPAVGSTSGIASTIGQWLKQNHKTKIILIGCAASASLGAIFNAPIAAIIFAVEVMMIDLTATSLIPLLIASLGATVTSRFFLGTETLFKFSLVDPFNSVDIPFYILLGLLSGLISVYFNKIYFQVASISERISNVWLRALAAGSLLGILVYLFPHLYGEGYDLINGLIQDDIDPFKNGLWFISTESSSLIVLILIGLALAKALAASFTIKGGGFAGIFAPALFIGSTVGYSFATLGNSLNMNLSVRNFTLVAMCGVMAGVLHAPLTAIFLIAEVSGGYELFIPLMIVSSISFITAKYFSPTNIYTRQLSQRGELLTHHKDQAVLTLMTLKDEIELNFEVIHPYDSLGDLVSAISKNSRNIFPVVDEEGLFLGVVNLNDVRQVMFETDKYESTLVHDYMTAAPEQIYLSDNMEKVMQKFDSSHAWNLPVLTESAKYLGFVSKSKLFTAYRKHLQEFYDIS